MRKIFYTPPKIIRRLFPHTIWETENQRVLLTFDDGPNIETTEQILRKLSEHKIKAAFFCLGENIVKNISLTKEILADEHLVGSHGWDHTKITKMGTPELIADIKKNIEHVSEQLNYNIKYFRPPYGKIYPPQTKIIYQLGLKTVMWSIMTYDFQNDFSKVKFAIDNFLHNNSIIVLHDSLKSKDIIDQSIDYVVESTFKKGFNFGLPEECLK
ncbi:MAG: polysaccharide deacetylase family protein [Melioribacteraceae bacterium]|nr:MAG: polysaccharide deacetylase family protein [Melioribacteraceae bacterium]